MYRQPEKSQREVLGSLQEPKSRDDTIPVSLKERMNPIVYSNLVNATKGRISLLEKEITQIMFCSVIGHMPNCFCRSKLIGQEHYRVEINYWNGFSIHTQKEALNTQHNANIKQ